MYGGPQLSRHYKLYSRQNKISSWLYKVTHGNIKLTHGKTKFTRGKTKKTIWSAVGQRLLFAFQMARRVTVNKRNGDLCR